MKYHKTIILSLITLFLLSAFTPDHKGISNLTKWACGMDTIIPSYWVGYNTETSKYEAWLIRGGIYVPPTGDAPIVLVGDDRTIPADQGYITLDGSASYSPGGSALTYLWEKVSGTGGSIASPTSATTSATGLIAGTTYKFKLTVTDANSLSASKVLTITVSALASAQYYIIDSALFNFTPVAQNISGYTDVVGDPARNVLSATSSQGWTVSTIAASAWNGDPNHSDSAAFTAGMLFTTPADPFGYSFDSSAITTGFKNYNSEQADGAYNIEVSNLDPSKTYQFIITGSTNAPDGTDIPAITTRSNYYVTRDQSHNMNTNYTTAREIKLDTIRPNSSGQIFMSVAGQQENFSGGSNGIISSMQINEISKTNPSGAITYSFRRFYDTVRIWDGYTMRFCVVAKPYNYNPAKEYPILMYFGGGESTVFDTLSWDAEVAVTEGAGYAIQHYEGGVYGINAQGDTCGFIIVIPQSLNNITSGTYAGEGLDKPGRIETLLSNFKSSTPYNYNDSLFVGGFSRGAAFALQYAYRNPATTTGAYIASAADGSAYYKNPTASQMATFAQSLTSTDVKFYFMHREDMTTSQTQGYIDTLTKYALGNISDNYWPRGHSGFAWDWIMNPYNYADQTVYDWFVNPNKADIPITKFSFDVGTIGNPLGFTSITNSKFNNQTATDPNTGVVLSTVKNGWANVDGRPTDYNSYIFSSIQDYNFDLVSGFYTRGYGTNNTGGYATWGDNLTLSNLTPNTSYRIFFNGYGNRTANNVGVMWYNGGTDSVVCHESYLVPERSTMHSITVTSSAAGTIGLGFYPSYTEGNGMAYLGWMVIRKTEQ